MDYDNGVHIKMKLKNILMIGLMLGGLVGCMTTPKPKYEVPTNTPTATIGAVLNPLFSRNKSTKIEFVDNHNTYDLFYYSYEKLDYEALKKDGGKKFASTQLQANKPIQFLYQQRSSDEVCSIRISATLKPNKSYTAIDKIQYGKGLLGFTNKTCAFAIIDNETGEMIGEYVK